MELSYEQILKQYGENAAKAFLEWQIKQASPKPYELNGDPIHDYLVEKRRM